MLAQVGHVEVLAVDASDAPSVLEVLAAATPMADQPSKDEVPRLTNGTGAPGTSTVTARSNSRS